MTDLKALSETAARFFLPSSEDDYFITKSFTWGAKWRDIFYDLGVFLGSIILGMIVYYLINGSPFKVIIVDMDTIDEKKEEYCYTIEEAREKYGPKEGAESKDDVIVCGEKLPKKRALKFLKYYGKKAGQAFAKLSFEEKYSMMTGALQFPDEFLRESMSEYWRGSKGKQCDACQDTPQGEQKFDVCGRCDYTACTKCRLDKKLGTCFCKDENFGLPYPPLRSRRFYQNGLW